MPQKIMIIDDEPDIQTYLAAAIQDNGFDALTPGVGEPYRESIIKEKPSLIILDIMMPMQSGISVYRELRAAEALRHIPIILISGMDEAAHFMKTGFRDMIGDESMPPPDGFMEKPVNLGKLMSMIQTILADGAP